MNSPLRAPARELCIRVGLPASTGSLPAVVEALGAPALVSAASLWDSERSRFRAPGFASADLDLALDSAGFTAMRQWQGYPWRVADYVALAFRSPWAWWAQMDLCCEPQIARDQAEVRRRVGETAQLLDQCRMQAEVWRAQLYEAHIDDGLSEASWKRLAANHYREPMPVLQGWQPDDYEHSAELLDGLLCGRWPAMVGVGSVCRRGRVADIAAVLSRLHRVLPEGVGLHLFGVKGSALRTLRTFPRVVSVDSQAWGNAARWEACHADASCTIEMKTRHIQRWMDAQTPGAAEAPQLDLFSGQI